MPKPLVFYHAVDPRDHFYTIAKVRTMQTAMGHFQNERLSIPGCIVRHDQHSCTSCEIAWFDVVHPVASSHQAFRLCLQCRPHGPGRFQILLH